MQLVIEISEANYEYFKNTHFIADEKIVFKQSPEDRKGTMNLFRLVDAVKDGIVLPKGHGRLIDADAFAKKLNEVSVRQRYEDVRINRLCTVADVLEAVTHDLKGTALSGFELTPTVIPAEKGE